MSISGFFMKEEKDYDTVIWRLAMNKQKIIRENIKEWQTNQNGGSFGNHRSIGKRI